MCGEGCPGPGGAGAAWGVESGRRRRGLPRPACPPSSSVPFIIASVMRHRRRPPVLALFPSYLSPPPPALCPITRLPRPPALPGTGLTAAGEAERTAKARGFVRTRWDLQRGHGKRYAGRAAPRPVRPLGQCGPPACAPLLELSSRLSPGGSFPLLSGRGPVSRAGAEGRRATSAPTTQSPAPGHPPALVSPCRGHARLPCRRLGPPVRCLQLRSSIATS